MVYFDFVANSHYCLYFVQINTVKDWVFLRFIRILRIYILIFFQCSGKFLYLFFFFAWAFSLFLKKQTELEIFVGFCKINLRWKYEVENGWDWERLELKAVFSPLEICLRNFDNFLWLLPVAFQSKLSLLPMVCYAVFVYVSPNISVCLVFLLYLWRSIKSYYSANLHIFT